MTTPAQHVAMSPGLSCATLFERGWDDLPRLVAFIRAGKVSAALVIERLRLSPTSAHTRHSSGYLVRQQAVCLSLHHFVAFAHATLETRAVKDGDAAASVLDEVSPWRFPRRFRHALAPHAEHVGNEFLCHRQFAARQPVEAQQEP